METFEVAVTALIRLEAEDYAEAQAIGNQMADSAQFPLPRNRGGTVELVDVDAKVVR